MLLLCLISLPPVWANEALYCEISNDEQPDFAQEAPQDLPLEIQEEISLFSPEQTDSNTNPYSVYAGKDKSRTVLKGGVRLRDESSNMTVAKDGNSLSIQKGKHELLVGSTPYVNDNHGGFFGYHKGRFAIFHSFERAGFRPELARNNAAIEPEFQLTKNLKLKTAFRTVQSQKGYSQGVALEYGKTDSRFKKVNNLKFEVKASASVSSSSDPVRRFGFNTKYYF